MWAPKQWAHDSYLCAIHLFLLFVVSFLIGEITPLLPTSDNMGQLCQLAACQSSNWLACCATRLIGAGRWPLSVSAASQGRNVDDCSCNDIDHDSPALLCE